MSTYKQAKIDIQKHFYTGWTAAGYSASIVAWLNEKFTKPSNSVWVRFTILNAGGQRVELGSADNKLFTGIVDVELFYPEDQAGLNTIYDYTDAIVAIFENQTVEGTHFDEHNLEGPNESEDGWLKTNISFPFQRYG